MPVCAPPPEPPSGPFSFSEAVYFCGDIKFAAPIAKSRP